MEKPEEAKNRHEKELRLILQSYDITELVKIEMRITNFIKRILMQQEEAETSKENYVWITTIGGK